MSVCVCVCVFPHHVVAVELLHDGGLVEELDALAHAGRLVDRLDGHAGVRLVLNDALGDALVHHAKASLAQLAAHGDLVTGHLHTPLHTSKIGRASCRERV